MGVCVCVCVAIRSILDSNVVALLSDCHRDTHVRTALIIHIAHGIDSGIAGENVSPSSVQYFIPSARCSPQTVCTLLSVRVYFFSSFFHSIVAKEAIRCCVRVCVCMCRVSPHTFGITIYGAR